MRYDGDTDGKSTNGGIGDGIFNDPCCSDDALSVAACTKDPIYVRDSVVVLMAGATPYIGMYNDDGTYRGSSTVDVTGGAKTVYAYVSGRYNGYLQSGSTISITLDNCKLNTDAEFVVPNTSSKGFSIAPIPLSEDTSTTSDFGVVTITATNPEDPSEMVTQRTFGCLDND